MQNDSVGVSLEVSHERSMVYIADSEYSGSRQPLPSDIVFALGACLRSHVRVAGSIHNRASQHLLSARAVKNLYPTEPIILDDCARGDDLQHYLDA